MNQSIRQQKLRSYFCFPIWLFLTALMLFSIPQTSGQSDGVRATVRRVGDHWLIVLVNEDHERHMGVEVTALKKLNGRDLNLLYRTEVATIRHGELITRMQPFEVQVFATSRKWETARRDGRDYKE